MNKLLDLRFVIGVFFTVVGLLLLAYSFGFSEGAAVTVNRWCGSLFAVFGVVMILLTSASKAQERREDDRGASSGNLAH